MTKKKESSVGYSATALEQIKRALKKYAAENNIKPEFYHISIKEELGLSPDDKRLHSSDPRHWLKPGGHLPNEMKLDIYAEFISKVYPDLKLSDSRITDYIEIGMMLRRFTGGEINISDAKLKKHARSLDGRFFTAGMCRDEAGDGLASFDMMSFRWITATPFILAYRFRVITPYKEVPWGPNSTQENIERLRKASEYIQDTVSSRDYAQNNIEKGIFSPLADGSGYHGIFHTGYATPNHALLIGWNKDHLIKGGFDYRSATELERYALGIQFSPVIRKEPCFVRAVDVVGDPVL